MNKQKLSHLLNNSHEISSPDREELHAMVKQYPYSQILHTLVAKANISAKTAIAQNTLSYAAMYATDRQVLKNFIQGDSKNVQNATQKAAVKEPISNVTASVKEEVQKITESDKKPEEPVFKINQQPQVKITIDDSKISENDELRNEVWANLNELKASKSNYMEWLEKSPVKPSEKEQTKVKRTLKNKDVEIVKKAAATKKAVVSSIKEKVKPKPTKAVKAVKAVKASKTKVTKTTKSAVSKKVAEKKSAAKKIVPKKKPEIKSKAVKKAPLKEQIKIIDKFIDKKPSISSKAITAIVGDQEDLSIASTKFGEDLVSENLALILVEQGKTEKAIDIYKKLIWKFPQKKAYFAAQIEELTK